MTVESGMAQRQNLQDAYNEALEALREARALETRMAKHRNLADAYREALAAIQEARLRQASKEPRGGDRSS
jgi:hypothetical protein